MTSVIQMKQPFMWNEAREKLLSTAWEQASAASIALVLGCSRDAVIGKANRMGLPLKRPARKYPGTNRRANA